MRRLLIASAGMALASGGAADAQHRPGADYDVPGTAMQAPMQTPHRPGPIAARPPVVHTSSQVGGPQAVGPQPAGHRAPRWGSKIGGRWWGGANAPGGWAAYRRPHRGWAVPGYWNAPRFYVNDWSRYGLPQPPQGYNWARYYDDAVLIDQRGSVYDTVSDTDWDRYDSGGYTAVAPRDYAQNDSVYAGPADRGYPAPYDDRAPRRDTGLGGAAIGAVAGGVAGNVIAGRGNRLGGTLIGAGVGAAAGYAIDKGEDRGRRAPRPRADYGAGYAPPPATYAPVYAPPVSYGAGYAQPRGYPSAPGGSWVSPDGLTTVTTTSGSVYPAGGTTVVVQSAPMVTTTTTEYYDTVSYTPRKAWRKRVRARPTCNCR
ncbi:glycine zipper 2TM protein [Sphingomonas sp. PP-F2F-A104-K0414]|uniref:RcnB family protein n=1 Tax=Sphingomonas sp. PP-F2F-A104-K0414 TaxID=2135661 RepID=UPI00104A7FB7|nr:RcnB family protein [Sphingomonas sp. PP-F2F-A104-K0414]TCP98881.1 glycine zipper 2TM protein [Sphingomonas sp. PP-F2F-A104-K0414]